MIVKIPIVWYLVIAMALYIVFLKSCAGNKCPVATVTQVVKHDTIINEYHDTVPIYDPAPEFLVTKWDTVFLKPGHLDSAGIIADYMSRRTYKDVIPNKYGFVTIIDTLYQNKIEYRKVSFDFKVPEITLTNTVQPRNQVYFGLDLGASNFLSLGPELILKTKANKLYWLGASVTSQNQLYYHMGAAWLIHF